MSCFKNKTMKGKIKLRKRDNNMEIFPYIQRMKKEKPYQLFCFPHAGGNSLTFAKWVDRTVLCMGQCRDILVVQIVALGEILTTV